jgi:hypothetical protein
MYETIVGYGHSRSTVVVCGSPDTANKFSSSRFVSSKPCGQKLFAGSACCNTPAGGEKDAALVVGSVQRERILRESGGQASCGLRKDDHEDEVRGLLMNAMYGARDAAHNWGYGVRGADAGCRLYPRTR